MLRIVDLVHWEVCVKIGGVTFFGRFEHSVNFLGVKRVCFGGDSEASRRVEGILRLSLFFAQFG